MSEPAPPRSRALLLTHVFPDPQGVGLARRGWRWACELAAQHDLEIVLITRNEGQPVPPSPLPGRLRVVHCTGAPIASRGLADWFDPDAGAARALAALEGPRPARIVVFRFYLHDMAAQLPPDWRAIAEMDCDDLESATRWSLAALALRRGRWSAARACMAQARGYAKLERSLLPAYATVHVSAFEDAARLRRLPGMKAVHASPNKLVPEPDLVPAPMPVGGRTLLFVGALFYPPNEDALLWFARAVLPALRRRVPDVRIVAAGRAEEALVQQLARHGIVYVHSPADLRPLYAEATAVIAPVRGGGGTKLKVLEAWQHERPLVATSHAARGLAVESGRHLLVADRPLEFARHCAALLADPVLAAALVRDAAVLLKARYCLDAPTR
ncbi:MULTISPECIES: glycosyltransferase family 4 protein [unclassified Variovorax]|uniref:glycosyltransferase family 4 protein n=1 Tax=unclassified Variovorax TaxID=663243 RepID=UPI0025790C7B|nr:MULTISPECIES: glycosyltransferase family 4 protein [unclassified Variovorax]MDM0091305.1 glycosyltransferase family 4 protein [Variovorax sp. J22G40]MDM0149468.1 glycosyltransferase family 4 protein [Variovorax sp. J2P1-31]